MFLTMLNVSKCVLLSDAAISRLGQECVNLVHLNISRINKLCEISLKLPKLQFLSVAECSIISEKSIQCIAKYCVNLLEIVRY